MLQKENDRPRFHPKAVIPEVPQGMVLVKFHGEPALIPEMERGEKVVGNTRFTLRQIDALGQLELKRRLEVFAID